MQSPLKGSGPTLHKCYPVLHAVDKPPGSAFAISRVLVIRFPLCDYVAMQEAVPGPKRHFAAVQQSVAFGGIADIGSGPLDRAVEIRLRLSRCCSLALALSKE
jgi:hypothetical protein